MVKCPNKNLPEWKELERLCPNTAYVVWDAFPEGIDKAPNGEPSKLFADLLNHYNGDRDAAIQTKAKTVTDAFKTWFKDSKVIDENGEPLVVWHGSDKVFDTFEDNMKMLSSSSFETFSTYANNEKTRYDDDVVSYEKLEKEDVLYQYYNDKYSSFKDYVKNSGFSWDKELIERLETRRKITDADLQNMKDIAVKAKFFAVDKNYALEYSSNTHFSPEYTTDGMGDRFVPTRSATYIYPVFLNVKNLLDASSNSRLSTAYMAYEYANKGLNVEYDGIKGKDSWETETGQSPEVFAVFGSNQIKSIDNVGDFSSSSNIYNKLQDNIKEAREEIADRKKKNINHSLKEQLSKFDNTKDAIEWMLEVGLVPAGLENIAKLLTKHSTSLSVKEKGSGEQLASYLSDTASIEMYDNAFRTNDLETAETVLHEVLHYYLAGLYETNTEYRNAITTIQKRYRSLSTIDEINSNYGLAAKPDEFVNEILTNSKFIELLKSKDSSLWERFKRAIAKLLRIESATALNVSDIQESLTKLLERTNTKTETFGERYKSEFAKAMSKEDSRLMQDLNTEVKMTRSRIEKGIQSRIKAFQQYGKATQNMVAQMEQELIKLQELWSKNEDKEAMMNFIKRTSKESEGPVKAINLAFEEYKKDGKFSLRNNQLVQMYKDFIGFYEPVINDINQKLFVTGYFDDLPSDQLEMFGNMINSISKDFNSIKGKYDKLLANRAGDILKQYAKDYGVDLDEYVNDNINYTADDISWYHTYIGGMKYTSDKALNIISRKVVDMKKEIERTTINKASELVETFGKVQDWQVFYETSKNGKKTGYLVRDRDYGTYHSDYNAFIDTLGPAPMEDKVALQKWYTERNKWLGDHSERRYVPEYYDLFNDMSFAAREARDGIQQKISKILGDHMDKVGNVNVERIPDEDWAKLQSLYQQKRRLANHYNEDGVMKSGIELEIANEISDINEKMNKNLSYSSNKKRFEEVRAKKESTLSKDDYNRWYARSTRWAYTDEFQKMLDNLEKKYFSDQYERYAKERKELASLYRNTHDFMINTRAMPDSVKARIAELDVLMEKEGAKNPAEVLEGTVKMKDIAKITYSEYYKAEAKAAKEREKLAPGSFLEWHKANHHVNNRGESVPNSYFNVMIPIKREHIEIAPSREFTEVDPSSPYWNNKYDITNTERNQPKKELYDNTDAYNKAIDTPEKLAMYNSIVDTMNEANDNITFQKYKDNYKLPQISGSMYAFVKANDSVIRGAYKYWKDKLIVKNDDVNFNYGTKAPDGSRLDTIPTHYMSMLDDPSTITNDIGNAVLMYYKMAIGFNKKQEILPELKILQGQIANRQQLENTPTSKLDKISGTVSDIADDVSNMAYSKGKGKSRSEIRLNRYMENNIFGNQYQSVTVGKFNIVKMLLGFKNYATLVNLGASVFVAAANVMGGAHQHLTESLVGSFYTPYTAAVAFKNTIYEFGKVLLGGGNYRHENKLLSLMNMNQISRDTSVMFKRMNYNRVARFLMNHLWYGMMSAGDFFIKGNILASVYLNTKYVPGEGFMMRDEYLNKHSKDKDASKKFNNMNTITLYDMYKAEGIKAVVDPARSEYSQYVTPQLVNRVNNVIQYLTQRADGMTDESDRNIAQANAITGFAFMHKNFILSTIEDRVMKPKDHNFMLERMDEAQYKTAARRLGEIFKYINDRRKYKKGSGEAKPTLRKLEYFEKYNVKRIEAESSLIIAYLLISVLLARDDDDDDTWATSAFKYVHDRATYEATNLYNVYDIFNSFKTLSPASATLENWATILGIGKALFNPDDTLLKTTKYGPYKGKSKLEKTVWKVTPLKNIIEATDPKQKHKYLKGQLQ